MNTQDRTNLKGNQRGVAIAAVCIVIVMINAALVHAVVANSADHATTAWRAQAVRAFFAAESGIAIIHGDIANDRLPQSGIIELEPGISVALERSADEFPLEVTATATVGIATRLIRVRLE